MKIGDRIALGRYDFRNDGEKLPVTWRVIGEREDAFLLITEEIIDWSVFNLAEPINWEHSLLRLCHRMLYQEMFDEYEKLCVLESDILTSEKNLYDEADVCPDEGVLTKDFLFSLSAYEAQTYFADDDSRKAVPTPYAEAQGVYKDKNTGCSCWWLRSRGYNSTYASDVLPNGEICASGDEVDEGGGLRPAMWYKKTEALRHMLVLDVY